MTIDPELLMAYADGELDPLAAKRVERAIADDPRLAGEVARHRALTQRLRAGFAPALQPAVPDAVTRLLEAPGQVVSLVPPRRRPSRGWIGWTGAIAASLVVGVTTGQMLARDDGPVALADGRATMRGDVARALDTQLASTQPADAPVRIGVTFRDSRGALCRTFEAAALAGIACSAGSGWDATRLYGGTTAARGAFRQAGSAQAAMMADAQALAAGAPLDAAAERRALADRRER